MNEKYFIRWKKYLKADNPKLSIIIAVYNKKKFILRILRSIWNQSFKYFWDQHSKDNSNLLIENYQKEDERLVLLRHKKRKGILVNKIDGVNLTKSENLFMMLMFSLLIII